MAEILKTRIALAEKALVNAKKRYADEINRRFPVGTDVVVRWGRGELVGVVEFPSKPSNEGALGIRSESGQVHWKHWSDVWPRRK